MVRVSTKHPGWSIIITGWATFKSHPRDLADVRVWGRHLGMGRVPACKEVSVDCDRKAPSPGVSLRKELTGESMEPHGSNVL